MDFKPAPRLPSTPLPPLRMRRSVPKNLTIENGDLCGQYIPTNCATRLKNRKERACHAAEKENTERLMHIS